jgi:hypothetical protein
LRYKIVADESFSPKIMSGISLTTSNGICVKLQRRDATTALDRARIRDRIRQENMQAEERKRAVA